MEKKENRQQVPLVIEELTRRNLLLQRKVEELKDEVLFLEAEVVAVGNLLISSGLLKQEDLAKMTEVVLKQAVAKRKSQESTPVKLTDSDLKTILNDGRE